MNARQAQYIKLLNVYLYDVQKLRIQMGNRIDALERSAQAGEGDLMYVNIAAELREDLFAFSDQMERGVERRVGRAVEAAPIMQWLKLVRGIGPRYSGSLIGMLGAPSNTVSELWSYCGMDVIPVCVRVTGTKPLKSGKVKEILCNRISCKGETEDYFAKDHFLTRQAERRWEQHLIKMKYEFYKDARNPTDDEFAEFEEYVRENEETFQRQAYLDSAEKLCQCDDPVVVMKAPKREHFKGLLLDHNPFLKSTCWKIAGQFVRQGKFYRTHYERYKNYYVERDGATLTAGHIENRARRATVKLFLSHLWEMWRKSLGMAAGEFYWKAKLGDEFDKQHTYIAPPHADLFDNIGKE